MHRARDAGGAMNLIRIYHFHGWIMQALDDIDCDVFIEMDR
jgi:hypothetical protein